MNIMKDLFISDIKPNTSVNSIFIVEAPSLRNGGRHGKYINCTLSDRTGKISCRIWGRNSGGAEEIERIFNGLNSNVGSVFHVFGESETYNNELLVRITDGVDSLTEPLNEESVSPENFEYTPFDIGKIRAGITSCILKIEDPSIRDFVGSIIGDADGFFEKPAARKKHHAFRGGLALHTLEVAGIALTNRDRIESISFDRDILIAGAVLHDIGKCRSFDRKGFGFSANASYSLLGHITPGVQMVERHRDKLENGVFEQILHIIQSHHGQYGEIKPQTIEAWAVHFADNMSATLHEVSEDIERIGFGESGWGDKSGGPVFRPESRK
ncbi:MAG: HD domain-containing protein [Methanomicrobiaceae archaeon]|nr:HD domain-containing protein [Methanomicrobiaceae archaeon]